MDAAVPGQGTTVPWFEESYRSQFLIFTTRSPITGATLEHSPIVVLWLGDRPPLVLPAKDLWSPCRALKACIRHWGQRPDLPDRGTWGRCVKRWFYGATKAILPYDGVGRVSEKKLVARAITLDGNITPTPKSMWDPRLVTLRNRYYAMKSRCTNPEHMNWHRYGGRGIKVLFNSLDEYVAYILEALPHPNYSGLHIDRINNNGDYEPGNLRLATSRENVWNSDTWPWSPLFILHASRNSA